jgi:NADPH-dependent 2,4-dienoyl-CoA reductase/sulfur reductase-like enzyme
MEAARVATLRGHQVTLFEKTGELGGAILLCCPIGGKNKMRWYADWLRLQISKLGVEVHLNANPDLEQLKSFDAVIIATGGEVTRPEIPGAQLPFIKSFEDVLRCGMDTCEFFYEGKEPPSDFGESVLVWGDHFGAADAAERLAIGGHKVTIVTENTEFAAWMEPCHKDVMMKRFAGSNGEGLTSRTIEHPVAVIPSTTVVEIAEDGRVTLMDSAFRKSTATVTDVVLAHVVPTSNLAARLVDEGIATCVIGDAKKIRNLRSAVSEGANAGLTLDDGLQLNANRAFISKLPTEIAF